jgi:hypothetical protein
VDQNVISNGRISDVWQAAVIILVQLFDACAKSRRVGRIELHREVRVTGAAPSSNHSSSAVRFNLG